MEVMRYGESIQDAGKDLREYEVTEIASASNETRRSVVKIRSEENI